MSNRWNNAAFRRGDVLILIQRKTLPSNFMSGQKNAVKSQGNREEIVSQSVCSEVSIRNKPWLGESVYTILDMRGTLSYYGYNHTRQPRTAVAWTTLRNSVFSSFLCIELRIVNKFKIASLGLEKLSHIWL